MTFLRKSLQYSPILLSINTLTSPSSPIKIFQLTQTRGERNNKGKLSSSKLSHLPKTISRRKYCNLNREMSDAYCSDCKRQTEVVFDHSAGDTVCSECGLVLESHSIDETSEWRTFANESGDNDPVRVGGPTNPLLADGGLSTVIAKPNGASGEFLSSSLGRWQNRGSNPDRGLILAFKTIATMSDRYVLVAAILGGRYFGS